MDGRTAANQPIEIDLEEGKTYFWCACGHSGAQPFCDGTHKEVNFSLAETITAARRRPVRLSSETPEKVWLCMCKQTKNPPYCDGTHKSG